MLPTKSTFDEYVKKRSDKKPNLQGHDHLPVHRVYSIREPVEQLHLKRPWN